MKRLNKITALLLILTLVLSTGVLAFAEGEPESQAVKTGFYIKDAENGNKFIDIYTFLNQKHNKTITDAGLENVLFVHQNGKGAVLGEILNGGELNDLKEENFEESYVDVANNKVIAPVLGLNLLNVVGENGKLTAIFEGIPAEGEPAVNNFTITKSVNGAEAKTVEIVENDLAWKYETRRTILTVPEVEQTEDNQKVVYTVTYKEQEPKTVEILVKGTIEYSFEAKLDKEEYKADEDITVSGKALKDEVGLADIDITLKIADIEGNVVVTVEQVKTDENGDFTHTFKVPEGTEAGTYKLTVKANDLVNESKVLDLIITPAEPTADEKAAKVVVDQINALPKVEELTLEDKVAVEEARTAYNGLTAEQQKLVVEDVLKKLTDAEAKIKDLTPTADEIPEAVIQDLASKISELYKNVAEEDKEAIRIARSNIETLEDSAWVELLTDEVVAKFGSLEVAKEKIGAAIVDLSELYYSVDSIELETRLMTLAEKHLPTYRTIFGNEGTVEELYSLFKAIVDNVPEAITPTQGNTLVEASDADLVNKIENIIKTSIEFTLDKEEFAKYKGKLSEVGLNVDTLISVKNNIASEIDTNNAAQIALINAYARAKAVVEGPTTIKVGENANYTLTVLGKDASTLANWSSSDENIATIAIDEKVVLTPVKEGTTTITVYRGENETNWIAKFDVTVESSDVVEPVPAPGDLVETEPNNSYEQANQIPIDTKVIGGFDDADYIDTFKFELLENKEICITLDNLDGLEMTWMLYEESDLEKLVAYPSSTENGKLYGEYNATSGIYYLLVYRDESKKTGYYSFIVSTDTPNSPIVPEVDTSAYDAIVVSVPENNDEGIYTEESWTEFEKAIAGCDLTLTAEAGQEALDSEVTNIQDALALLVKVEDQTEQPEEDQTEEVVEE